MKPIIVGLKKTEAFSALSIRLVHLTGKSKIPLHPKHLIRTDLSLYKELVGKNKKVLDLGCGPGQHSLLIAKLVKKVVGVDKDKRSLEIAKKDAEIKEIKNIEFREANVEKKLPFRDYFFDSVICIDILEHVRGRQGFLRDVKRLMKKGAVILVVIPNKDTEWKKLERRYGVESVSDPDHKIEYTRESIQEELKKAGFKVKEVEPIGYDTPFVGFIDLVGGISLSLYKSLLSWKARQAQKKPWNSIGFKVIAVKV